MAAMVMLEKQSVKTMTTQELLSYAIRKVGMAAMGAAKKIFIMAIKGFGTLMLVIGPLILAILAVQHVFQKFGPIAGAATAILAGLTLAFYYNKIAIWLWGRQATKATVQTVAYSSSMQAAAISSGALTAAEAAKMQMTVVSTTATAGNAMWIKIAAGANWLYTAATGAATAVVGAFTGAIGAMSAAMAASYAVMGPWLIVMLAVAAIMGIIIGAMYKTGEAADWTWGNSVVPDAFDKGSREIKGTVTGLDDELAALGMFNMSPTIPGINRPVVPGGGGRPSIFAPTVGITYEGGITLGGDEATLRKFKKMQEEAVELAMKKTLREAEKEMQRGVMW